nr:SDR family NAD(P)-dependent oxidoreductase [Leptospira interrogans]
MNQKNLEGKVALVTGATRGAGRGIALALGEAGVTVYVTGISIKDKHPKINRKETIEETAERINKLGGKAIWAQVDHTNPKEVKSLFERIDQEQGKLNILVNDIYGEVIPLSNGLVNFGHILWKTVLKFKRIV